MPDHYGLKALAGTVTGLEASAGTATDSRLTSRSATGHRGFSRIILITKSDHTLRKPLHSRRTDHRRRHPAPAGFPPTSASGGIMAAQSHWHNSRPSVPPDGIHDAGWHRRRPYPADRRWRHRPRFRVAIGAHAHFCSDDFVERIGWSSNSSTTRPL